MSFMLPNYYQCSRVHPAYSARQNSSPLLQFSAIHPAYSARQNSSPLLQFSAWGQVKFVIRSLTWKRRWNGGKGGSGASCPRSFLNCPRNFLLCPRSFLIAYFSGPQSLGMYRDLISNFCIWINVYLLCIEFGNKSFKCFSLVPKKWKTRNPS